jgi:hypothetical protein
MASDSTNWTLFGEGAVEEPVSEYSECIEKKIGRISVFVNLQKRLNRDWYYLEP